MTNQELVFKLREEIVRLTKLHHCWIEATWEIEEVEFESRKENKIKIYLADMKNKRYQLSDGSWVAWTSKYYPEKNEEFENDLELADVVCSYANDINK